MAKMIFRTRYSHVPQPGEENSGELITEQAGYIPPQVQIESMISAGIRLEEFRKAQVYDFAPDAPVDEDFSDVTRSPGFDPADASQLSLSLRAKALSSEKRRKVATLKKKEEVENGSTQTNDRAVPGSVGEHNPGDNPSAGSVVAPKQE